MYIILLLSFVCLVEGQTVLIEAEGFENAGGWVVDQQFMDVMGSPYLLAHGLGEPVADATTQIELPAAGKYRVWVRTRDWVAPWNAPGTPGRFQVVIDGKCMDTKFGTEGADWHWQDGGTVEIAKTRVAITLHDLTGFEGRCDGIVLTKDPGFQPPNEPNALAAFRRKMLGLADKPIDAGTFDLVVVGGGMAGSCTAISAARLGIKVALIQDRPVLGGNNSSEVRVWLGGETNYEPYPHIGDIVKELDPKRRAHYGSENIAEIYEDDKKLAVVKAEPNIRLFLNMRAVGVEKEGKAITAVITKDIRTSKEYRFAAGLFVDCTGDGAVGFLAGADFEMTTEGHMGPSNLWNVVDTGRAQSFPRVNWAIDLSNKPFPGRGENASVYGQKGLEALGGWYWESGFFYNPVEKAEYIRDLNLRAMYGAWDALKNVDKAYPNHKLAWAAFIAGKRESRRLMGDVILNKDDLLEGRPYDDGCVPTSWDMDLHLPAPQYKSEHGKDAFISKDYHTQYKRPYWIPYRCLYSRNIENLFMAGRDISVTHDALGSVRVMRTGGMMGEVVGMAAAVCHKHKCTPREVYERHLSELRGLMKAGAGKGTGKPQKMVLCDFGAGLDANIVSAVNAKATVTEEGAVRVETEKGKELSGVILKSSQGEWDLSQYAEVSVEVKNAGDEEVRIYLRIDNANANMWNNSNLQSVTLKGGEKRVLSTYLMLGPWRFDKAITLIGMRGAPGDKGGIDPSKVTQICIFADTTRSRQQFEIGSVTAGGEFKTLEADKFLPFIDEFGQFAHNDWPGKTHSLEELQEHREAEEKDLLEKPGPDNWDKWGGYKNGPRLEATGFFRVEKYQDKWWLVDPEGNLFWSHGIDCVRMENSTPISDREDYFMKLPDDNSPLGKFYGTGTWGPHGYYENHSPYRTYDFTKANLLRKYGEGWELLSGEFAHKRLRGWGINTIANWSKEDVYLMRKTPYTATIGYNGPKIEGSEGYWSKFYDVFDAGFRQSLQKRLEQEKGKSAGDAWCIGFFVDNELSWGDETSLGLAALVSPAEQQAKKVFVDDLKVKYQTIEKLNAAWGTSFADWDALLQSRQLPPKKEDWAKHKAYPDLAAFYTKIAETYFQTIREEVKRIAPEQLYLGCRFAWTNDLAVKAATKYCDVVSINRYEYSVEGQRLADNIDKPIIIGEFHFGALDRGMFHTGLKRSASQQDRAEKYKEYVEGALRNRYIVGTHWFQYQDQATTGRGDGENYQIGFVDIADTPYPEITAASRETGQSMYEYRLKGNGR